MKFIVRLKLIGTKTEVTFSFDASVAGHTSGMTSKNLISQRILGEEVPCMTHSDARPLHSPHDSFILCIIIAVTQSFALGGSYTHTLGLFILLLLR